MTSIQKQDFCCFIMASYFGEIIEPTTRAIFDDYSDDEDTFSDTNLQLSWIKADEKLPSVFDVIFIVHGRLSLAFAESFFLDDNSTPSAEINTIESIGDVDKDVEEIHAKVLPSRIYVNKNKAICLVSPSCTPDMGYQFTETISSLLRITKKVIVMTNDSSYNFKASSLNELPAAFIKELKTSHNKSQDLAPKLPAPNFISGIPAAVISWCQIFEKDGSAFICYSDQQKLDSITASPYIAVFKKLGYSMLKNENLDFNKKTFYGKPEVIGGSSNIYI